MHPPPFSTLKLSQFINRIMGQNAPTPFTTWSESLSQRVQPDVANESCGIGDFYMNFPCTNRLQKQCCQQPLLIESSTNFTNSVFASVQLAFSSDSIGSTKRVEEKTFGVKFFHRLQRRVQSRGKVEVGKLFELRKEITWFFFASE